MHVFNLKRFFFAQDKFITPRAVLSLALFNGFRVLGTKNVDPEDLRLSVEGFAFKPGSQCSLEPMSRVMCHASAMIAYDCNEEPKIKKMSARHFDDLVSWLQAFGIGHDASTCHRWVIEG